MVYLSKVRVAASLLVCGAFCLTAVATLRTFTVSAESPDVAAIQGVVQASQIAEQTSDIVPVKPGPGQSSVRVSPVLLAAWTGQIRQTVARLYTGDRLRQMTKVLEAHATVQQGSTSVEVGGGVDSIQFGSVSVHGSAAVVTIRVVKYLEWANRDATGNWPVSGTRSVVHFRDTLVKTPQGWRIASEAVTSFGDREGSGP